MLRCEECGCRSEAGRRWVALVAEDPEDGEGPAVCTYCPPCAEREMVAVARELHYV